MSEEMSSRTAYQDSNNGSVSSKGTNSPIAVARSGDRGSLYIISAVALALAAWSVARVGYLHDEMLRQSDDNNHRADQQAANFMYHATEMQTDYFLHAAQQAQATEREIVHYRDKFTELERQYRMAELKYDNVNLSVRRAGISLPGDYWTGPGGNLDSESFHIDAKRR